MHTGSTYGQEIVLGDFVRHLVQRGGDVARGQLPAVRHESAAVTSVGATIRTSTAALGGTVALAVGYLLGRLRLSIKVGRWQDKTGEWLPRNKITKNQ